MTIKDYFVMSWCFAGVATFSAVVPPFLLSIILNGGSLVSPEEIINTISLVGIGIVFGMIVGILPAIYRVG